MINSMTGYGSAEGQLESITYAVEVKTVNNRYFTSRIKLPEMAAFLEEEIEKFLRKNLLRGTVHYVLNLKNISANALFDIDERALQAYMEKLSGIASSSEVECPIDIGGLLSLPGMLVPRLPDEEVAKQVREKVLSITQEAVVRLKEMRAAEGAALAADLDNHCEVIKRNLEQIRARSSTVLEEYAKKLTKRVGDLLSEVELQLDETTLVREVAVFADRSDISEEITRLDSHLEQFIKSCQSSPESGNEQADVQVGRRLDFITQEMLREANTIASKASDTEIIHWVVDIKCRIDRIKEQVQNIE